MILAANWGRPVLQIIYRPEYADYASLFVWLVFAAGIGFVGSFLGYAISAMRHFNKFAVPYTLVMLLSAAGCWLLIPRYGLLGAAWAVCISSALLTSVPLFIFRITDSRVLVGLQRATVMRLAVTRE